MACLDVDLYRGILLALEQPLICSEGVQNLVIFTLRLTLTKYPEDLAATRQIV